MPAQPLGNATALGDTPPLLEGVGNETETEEGRGAGSEERVTCLQP